jgi:hypothetical protein
MGKPHLSGRQVPPMGNLGKAMCLRAIGTKYDAKVKSCSVNPVNNTLIEDYDLSSLYDQRLKSPLQKSDLTGIFSQKHL